MSLLRRAFLILALWGFAVPAFADARITQLMQALEVSEVVKILRDEGLGYAKILDEDMLDGQGGPFFAQQAASIYDTDAMSEALRASIARNMDPPEIDAALEFYATDLGARLVARENRTRREMRDPGVEAAARDLYDRERDAAGPLSELIFRYMDAGDLVARNTAGVMTSDVWFQRGLADGDFLDRSETQILRDVWAAEPEIAEDTESWMGGFLLLAYQGFTEQEMAAYVAFAESPAGRALNIAFFDGFEGVFNDISYALGRAIALNAQGDEI